MSHNHPYKFMSLAILALLLAFAGLGGCSDDDASSAGINTDHRNDNNGGLCQPDDMRDDGCNTCECDDQGRWICTTKVCLDAGYGDIGTGGESPYDVSDGDDAGLGTPDDASAGDASAGRCTPGDTRNDGCNACVCDDDGWWNCTATACEDAGPADASDAGDSGGASDASLLDDASLPGDAGTRCWPGDTKKLDCNSCVCNLQGTWDCTERACYNPCQGLTCGEECLLCPPGDRGCTETDVTKFCDAQGLCAPVVPTCEPLPYDPCDGKSCGERCTLCPPGDETCHERGGPKYCDENGRCSGRNASCPF